MAGARVAQIKIVRGAECTSLIRKFQCFVASASPPSPRSRATRRQRRRLEAVRCTDVVTVRPFEQLQLALAPGARGVIGPTLGWDSSVHYFVTFYNHLIKRHVSDNDPKFALFSSSDSKLKRAVGFGQRRDFLAREGNERRLTHLQVAERTASAIQPYLLG